MHKSSDLLKEMPYIAVSLLSSEIDGQLCAEYFCYCSKMLISQIQTFGENKAGSTRRATNFGQNYEEGNARIVSNLLVREIHVACERTRHKRQLCLIHNKNTKEAKSVFLWFSDY